jgi:effector-binding domain-containing protein
MNVVVPYHLGGPFPRCQEFRTGLERSGSSETLALASRRQGCVGVEVTQPFIGSDPVYCSSTPAGTAATTEHFGPYDRLGEAHEAICRWCADQGLVLAGPSWEVYGHWTNDPEQLKTAVYYLLRGVGGPAG